MNGEVDMDLTERGRDTLDVEAAARVGGNWDGRSPDPSLHMFREAVRYAESRGLSPDYMPELRSENGVLHAFKHNGKKLRLEHGPGWEDRSGYAALVDELKIKMRTDRARTS